MTDTQLAKIKRRLGIAPDDTEEKALIEDLVMGCGYPEGITGKNIGRQTVVRAGLPLSVAGVTVSRFCASGLQAIAMAADRIVAEGVPAMVAGGVESISAIRAGLPADIDPWLMQHKPDLYMAMIDTADIVAHRYGISREDQDLFSLESQKRTAAAQDQGLFADEIVPCATRMAEKNKDTGEVTLRDVVATRDYSRRAPRIGDRELFQLVGDLGLARDVEHVPGVDLRHGISYR